MNMYEIFLLVGIISMCILVGGVISYLVVNTIRQYKNDAKMEKIAKAELQLEIAKMTKKEK